MTNTQGSITQQKLNLHLWKAVDLLRGVIDSGAYKQYIFGLLFYKRLCDVWNERYVELLSIHHGDHDKVHSSAVWQFTIPYGCMWYEEHRPSKGIPNTLRKSREQVGVRLSEALKSIEEANPSLQDIFRNIDFSDSRRFSDELINQLLDHLQRCRQLRV